MARHVQDEARHAHAPVCAPFMESQAERAWIDDGAGEMGQFMLAFNPHARPMSSADEFLALFEGTRPLFIHAVQATQKEFAKIASIGGSIAHCPRSNRLLGTGALDIRNIGGATLSIGTDGLSSNTTLSLWDEMRGALMTHQNIPLDELCALLLRSATIGGAKALEYPRKGLIKADFDADIIALRLKESPRDEAQLMTQLVLHTSEAERVYIGGERVR
jgi:cytosine/adenosine deaminase-related metal-dependent hydrolase